MFAALGMGEIGSIVLVNCETEAAFKASDVVLEEVGILVCNIKSVSKYSVMRCLVAKPTKVYCLKRKLS